MKFALYSAAIAALASSAYLYNQADSGSAGEGSSQLFLTERLTQEEIAFINWTSHHGKSYRTKEEFKFRFGEFKKSLDAIAKHDEGYHGSTVGLNDFSDLTKEEFKKMLGYRRVDRSALEEHGPKTEEVSKESDPNLETAKSIDWRKEGAVTPIKNQGVCGSCWTFAATGGLEGAYAVKYGTLRDFSEQYFVDCVKQNICNGCEGGHQYYAWKFLKDNNKGATLQSVYKYNGKDTNECKSVNIKDQYAYVQKSEWVEKNAMMMKVRLNYRPIAVSIEGENDFFRHYSGGIIQQGCGENLDHAVSAIGYGTDDGQDYFIIKNSWGSWWGDKGYAKIAPNQCGVTLEGIAVYVD